MSHSKEYWTKIYDILVRHKVATENWRKDFLQYSEEGFDEFRLIGGILGFGGKIWNTSKIPHIDCYKEEYSLKKLELIRKVNKEIKELKEGINNG